MRTRLPPFVTEVEKAFARSTRLRALLRKANLGAVLLGVGTLLGLSLPALAQFSGQGALTGSGVVGQIQQTSSVALSADGNTALFGGPANNSNTGAAWVFTRSAGIWTQQTQIVSPDSAALFGKAVALSADGNTALIGGPADNSNTGAVWVFTRNAGVWTQQTTLVSPDAAARFGNAVALSTDGSTAVIGAPGDNTNVGAAWVFTSSAGMWSPQAKLLASDATGQALQGFSVSLTADGNTAMVGGYGDNANTGAAWIFTRSGTTWTQQGSKLVGTGAVGQAQQGYSVALSGDGSTALMGGPVDNNQVGATWPFTNSGGTWTQQGAKLVGSFATEYPAVPPEQGFSVALSGDGNSALIGAPHNGFTTGVFGPLGASGVFTKSGGTWIQQQLLVSNAASLPPQQGSSVALSGDQKTILVGGDLVGQALVFVERPLADTHDFNGDFRSDILWHNAGSGLAVWLMNGGQVLQSAAIASLGPTYSVTDSSILGQHDFDGDGNADILWRDRQGGVTWITFMNGVTPNPNPRLIASFPANFSVVGTGDLNGDGMASLLWRDSDTATLSAWLTLEGPAVNFGVIGSTWTIAAEGNGYILWRDTAGDVARWLLQGGAVTQSLGFGNVPNNFLIAGVGDFNGDGYADILWNDTNTGTLSIWFLNATGVQSAAAVGTVTGSWNVAQTGDYDGDSKSDILWLDTSGNLAMWLMNGATVSSSIALGNVGTSWQVLNLNSN